MPVVRIFCRLLLALAAIAALAGCETLGIPFGSPPEAAQPLARAIDYKTDDLTALIFAIDLPAGIRPVPGGSTVTLDVSGSKGQKHFSGTLALADGEAVSAVLPAPQSGHTYVMFGFSPKDKAAIQNLQKWIRTLPDGEAPVVALDVQPKVCEAASTIDPSLDTYAVLSAFPGTGLLPIVSASPLARLSDSSTGQLNPCHG